MKHTQPMLPADALDDSVILITGGGTGLGYSMTKYFLQCGAKCIISSRKQDVIDKAAEQLHNETGGEVLAVACDVRKYAEIENVISLGVAKFGRINGLVNNAAGNFISPTERLTHKAFDVITDIVMRGSYNTTLSLGKYWIAEKIKANILNIVTTYAWTGSGYVVPSAMAKAGVLAMTRSLAVEWAKYNIRTNAIAPGPFPTEGAWQRLFPKGLEEIYDPKKRIPLRRFGEHQELANVAAYLMSDFSAYVNGEVITIDGGEWLQGAGEFNDLDKLPAHMWDALEAMTRGKSKD
jgi:NAD(P)-dependent dehydrogenase (short-subunit alcohol dehydrogenase family)